MKGTRWQMEQSAPISASSTRYCHECYPDDECTCFPTSIHFYKRSQELLCQEPPLGPTLDFCLKQCTDNMNLKIQLANPIGSFHY